MFLRNEKTDPKQQALDNVLMMLVHKKMTAPARGSKRMTPSYPPARDGSKNYEPTFNPLPVSRKGGASNPNIMTALKMYMDRTSGPAGSFNPDAHLDTSMIQDVRTNDPDNLAPAGASAGRWVDQQNSGPFMGGPLSRTKGKGFGDELNPLGEDGGFQPRKSQKQLLLEMLMKRGAFAGDGYNVRPGPMFRNGE